MDAFSDNSIWDLSQATSFSQLPDEDFLALLQKQFPQNPHQLGPTAATVGTAAAGTDFGFGISPAVINPQSLNLTQQLPLPSLTPPSEDSSPSPPRHDDEAESSRHKRKASEDDDFEPGPSTKSQHTGTKKSSATTTKRKSSGAGGSPDEGRLMKRKEQNRAAQRAFRERKEKHVKDLEDKVAALEAKNTAAVSENENLKDLLTRLQNENMALRSASFTFSIPKNGGSGSSSGAAPLPASSPASSSSLTSPPQSIFASPYITSNLTTPQLGFNRIPTNALDMSSLTSFDPNMLNLLDEPAMSPHAQQQQHQQQQTATAAGDSLATNFGFGSANGGGFLGNFRTIASNPLFTSLSTYFDEPLSAGPKPGLDLSAMTQFGSIGDNTSMQHETTPPKDNNPGGVFDIDFSNLTSWPSSSGSSSMGAIGGDDLFAGVWGLSTPFLGSTSSISPIVHQASPPSGINGNSSSPSSGVGLGSSLSRDAQTPYSHGGASSSSSSSSSAGASPASNNSDPSSATSMSDVGEAGGHQHGDGCPKTKSELADRIRAEGSSPFTQPAFSTSPASFGLTSPSSMNSMNGMSGAQAYAQHMASVLPHSIIPSGMLPPQPQQQQNNNTNSNMNGTGPGKVMQCSKNSAFPTTEMSDKNVEITTAWRAITNDPNHKAVDINLLCSEFSSKARCDGSKVVIQPEGLEDIKRLVNEKNASAMVL